jgi:hypothetical protein
MTPLKIGDKVIIIHSPYSSVKPGTIATIVDVKFSLMTQRWVLFILDTKPCNSFRGYEIKKI